MRLAQGWPSQSHHDIVHVYAPKLHLISNSSAPMLQVPPPAGPSSLPAGECDQGGPITLPGPPLQLLQGLQLAATFCWGAL